jgi:hypothetical protein
MVVSLNILDSKNEKLEKLKFLLPEKSEDELLALLEVM